MNVVGVFALETQRAITQFISYIGRTPRAVHILPERAINLYKFTGSKLYIFSIGFYYVSAAFILLCVQAGVYKNNIYDFKNVFRTYSLF